MSNSFDSDFATPSDWATLYRMQGIQVVPGFMPSEVKTWKRPLLKSWTEFQEALIPDEVFLQWYGPNGLYVNRQNMGVICGHASNNTFIIDLDIHKNPAAAQWWQGVLAVHNNSMELETAEQRTGGGGLQKLFHAPANWIAPTNKTSIGVDIRGQGGFAVLCPSMHESGKAYQWLEGRSPDEIQIQMAPNWLLEAVEEVVRKYGGVSSPGGNGPVLAPPAQEDGFGALIDGRESYMRDLIWAAVVDWYRECPIKPSDEESRLKCAEKYLIFHDHVEPQALTSLSKMDQLEVEGRGTTLFHVKWQAAIRQWDGKVAAEAQKVAPPKPAAVFRFPEPGPVNQPTSGPLPPLEWLDMSNWDHEPVPERKWAVRNRIPRNQVGFFSGEGGSGKSIIELMKNTAHCMSKDWLGSMPEPGSTMYLGAEDEKDELHRRMAAIVKHYGVTFKELVAAGMRIMPLLGKDSMLVVPVGKSGRLETTLLYRQLLEEAGDIKPVNITIDTLSRAFGGNEIDRVQVYAFVMHMQALAQAGNCSVTILSHPSLTGISSGTGMSGSTGWHGAARFRMYLRGVKDGDEDAEDVDDLRELEFKKNQYGPREQSIVLRYKDGLFLPITGTSDPERVAREARVDGLFVKLLRKFCERQDRVTHLASSPNYYAPKVFADEPEAKQLGFRKGEFETAMKRLMDGKRVLIEIFGKESRRQTRLILAPGT